MKVNTNTFQQRNVHLNSDLNLIKSDDFWWDKKFQFESPIFARCNEVAKLGKAFTAAFNQGEWLTS